MANFALFPLGNIDPAEVLSFVHLIEQWGAIIINVVLDIIKPVVVAAREVMVHGVVGGGKDKDGLLSSTELNRGQLRQQGKGK